MAKNIKTVKVKRSLLGYFKMMLDFDNEGEQTCEIIQREFEEKLGEALSTKTSDAKIEWVD